MVSIEAAFSDAWRSWRIEAGDDAASLPDPLDRASHRRRRQQRGGQSSKAEGKRRGGLKVKLTRPKRSSQINKEAEEEATGGGFLPDDAGEEDLGGGGFLPEGDNGNAADAGGFLPEATNEEDNEEEEEDEPVRRGGQEATHIPLSHIPFALENLSLASNDEQVLDLFAERAVYMDSDEVRADEDEAEDAGRRRRRGAGAAGGARLGVRREKMVSREDFGKVAEVLLLDVEEEEDGSEVNDGRGDKETDEKSAKDPEEEDVEAPGRRRMPRRAAARTSRKANRAYVDGEEDDEDGGIDFDVEDSDEASYHSNDDEEDSGLQRRRPRRSQATPQKPKASRSSKQASGKSTTGGQRRKRRRTDTEMDESDEEEEQEEKRGVEKGVKRLSAGQRRYVETSFQLFTKKLRELQPSASERSRLSRRDIKLLVDSVGEKMTEKEVRIGFVGS